MDNELKSKVVTQTYGPSLTVSLRAFTGSPGRIYCYKVSFVRRDEGLVIETGAKLFYTYASAERYFNKLN